MIRRKQKNKGLLEPVFSASPDVVALFVVVAFVCFYAAGSIATYAAQK